jgi:HPt (histidine-containing phosphotransfer) domain-containing protein
MSAASARWMTSISDREQLLGQDTVRRMSSIFLEELELQLSSALEAARTGDLHAARRAMHSLGGNAGALDLLELAALAQKCEAACLAKDASGAEALVREAIPLARENAGDLRQRFGLT